MDQCSYLSGKISHKQNLVWNDGYISKEDRNRQNQHQSGVLWFTGLPGAGKSTLARQAEKELFQRGMRTYVLDGDNVRHGLNNDLGFDGPDGERISGGLQRLLSCLPMQE